MMVAVKESGAVLKGNRWVMERGSKEFPAALRQIPQPPERLYVIGDPEALSEGLAVVGARKATPYGKSCARHFASLAASAGVAVISGGAYGCDSEAHRGALEAGGRTVAFLGGGCDRIYPAKHFGLFQEIIDHGGAIASEYDWSYPPLPQGFRLRNRLIAGLAKATLIVEAGIPSGTFSTADEALSANRDVLVVPGSISSPYSAGANRLLFQGAAPIIDDETFSLALCELFGALSLAPQKKAESPGNLNPRFRAVLDALRASPMGIDAIIELLEEKGARPSVPYVCEQLAIMEVAGQIARYGNGTYGPVVQMRRFPVDAPSEGRDACLHG